MSTGSILAAQVGYKTESVVGTGVTVDTFAPLVSFDIKMQQEFLPYQGQYAGRRTQTGKKLGAKKVTGTLKTELSNKPLACLHKHMYGTSNTTGSGPYVHTASPGVLDGKSLTIQGGIPDTGGTVRPFTWTGCKLPTWTISSAINQIAMLEHGIFAMDEDEDGTPSLASSSYLSGIIPFSFVEASITAGGASLGVISDMSLTCNNGLATERFGLGSATAAEALEADRRSYTGTMSVEFKSLVAYALYEAGTDFALVFTFSNGTDSLVITTNAYYTGETPSVQAGGLTKQNLPFTCQGASTDAGCITSVLTNAEASAA